MNKEWARQRLNDYLAAIRGYEAARLASGFNQQAYEKVISLEPAAKAIMKRVNSEYRDYQFVQNAHTLALTLTIQTLALIDEADEIEKNLDPVGPQLPAAELHYWVWEAARSLWETQHYREAVQAAATSINAHLQDFACRQDISDYRLIVELFRTKVPNLASRAYAGQATHQMKSSRVCRLVCAVWALEFFSVYGTVRRMT